MKFIIRPVRPFSARCEKNRSFRQLVHRPTSSIRSGRSPADSRSARLIPAISSSQWPGRFAVACRPQFGRAAAIASVTAASTSKQQRRIPGPIAARQSPASVPYASPHGRERPRRNSFGRPAPSGVDRRHRPADRVMDQDRQAIRRGHDQGQAWQVGDQRVEFGRLVHKGAREARSPDELRVHPQDAVPVDLLRSDDARRRRCRSRRRTAAGSPPPPPGRRPRSAPG